MLICLLPAIPSSASLELLTRFSRWWQVWRDVELDSNVARPRVVFAKGQHLLYHWRKLYRLRVARALPRKAEQVFDNPFHAAGFIDQLAELIADIRRGDGIADQFAVPHDHGQGIIEFMRHSCKQLSQGGQLF
jgi:hypothetical protein